MANNEDLVKEIERLRLALDKATQQKTQAANRAMGAVQTGATAVQGAGIGGVAGGAIGAVGQAASGDIAGAIATAITTVLTPLVAEFKSQNEKSLGTPEKRAREHFDSFAAAGVKVTEEYKQAYVERQLEIGGRRREAQAVENKRFQGSSATVRVLNTVFSVGTLGGIGDENMSGLAADVNNYLGKSNRAAGVDKIGRNSQRIRNSLAGYDGGQ